MEDPRRGARWMLGLWALVLVGIFGLFTTVYFLGYYLVVLGEDSADRGRQAITYQLLADVPFALAAICAVRAMRARTSAAGWRWLAATAVGLLLGFAVLVVDSVTG